MNERWQQAFWTNSHTSPPLLQISAPAPSPCSHFHPSPTPHPPSRWAQPWESVLPDPAIAAPAEEIIGASRRVITGGGCEIAATKLCLWPRDQPQPSPAQPPLLPRLLLIPPLPFLSVVFIAFRCSDPKSPNSAAKNK